MRIEVRLDRNLVRHWQRRVIERLEAAGHAITVTAAPAGLPLPAGLTLIESLETLTYKRPSPFARRLGTEEIDRLIARPRLDGVDLILDLAGSGFAPVPGVPRLRLTIDGLAPELGLAASLLDRRPPFIDVDLDRDDSSVRLVSGLPAVPEADVFVRAIESVAARAIVLTMQGIEAVATGRAGSAMPHRRPAPIASPIGAAGFALDGLAGKVGRKLMSFVTRRRDWVVGWRRLADDAVGDTLRWPAMDYAWLPDDGGRYYADPHIHVCQGRPYLFVEEYPYATSKGILSVSEWTGSGWTVPRPIIEEPHHLSWPHVFEHDGAIWMVPESGAARTLDLYRAVEFPYVWERAGHLVEGRSLSDATFLRRPDGWWMIAGSQDEEGVAPYDGLTLMRSDRLLSGWQAAGPSSVLIDARSARPAGAILRQGESLTRVAQDCTTSYGCGLTFARIDRLAEGVLDQTIVGRLGPRPGWDAIGVHTLNMGGGFEVIDINRAREMRRNRPFGDEAA